MERSTIRMKRVLWMAAVPALLLVAVVVYVADQDARHAARARAEEQRAAQVAGYRSEGLAPCDSRRPWEDTRSPAIAPGEIGINLYPAFHRTQYLRLSATSMQGYEDHTPYVRPPSADAAPTRPHIPPPIDVRSNTAAAVAVDPAFGERLTRWLADEIVHAGGEDVFGLDGVTYVLRVGDACAIAWSPDPGTRRGRIIALVTDLYDASRTQDARAAARMRQVEAALSALEAETRTASP